VFSSIYSKKNQVVF